MQKREVRGIKVPFHYLGPIAINILLGHVTVFVLHDAEFQVRQLGQNICSGTHVSPNDFPPITRRIGFHMYRIVMTRAGGDIRQIYRPAIHIEFPAMIDAT